MAEEQAHDFARTPVAPGGGTQESAPPVTPERKNAAQPAQVARYPEHVAEDDASLPWEEEQGFVPVPHASKLGKSAAAVDPLGVDKTPSSCSNSRAL